VNQRPRHLLMLMTALLLVTIGCARTPKLDTSYGRTSGSPGLRSVNGTSVLVKMFESAGHDVTTVNRFSPRLERADVIVWFPDDFAVPSLEHRQYLEEWLSQRPERTVVYVGRDYDAAADYWRQATPYAPPEQTAEYHRKLAEAITAWNSDRGQIKGDEYARWFKTKTGLPMRTVTKLEGPWAEGIDPKKCDIKLATRFEIPKEKDRPAGDYQRLPQHEVLLSSEDEPLVMRINSPAGGYDGQILVVTNGSFLLNFPLVNKEHRKLAGRVINECDIGYNVVFVESDSGGPPIQKRDADPKLRTGFDMLTVWPLSMILLHGLAWLLLVCICLYPIFGRPRRVYGAFARGVKRVSSPLAHLLLSIPPEDTDDDAPHSTGDFGRHLGALGDMLSLTGDRAYAEEKLRYYREHVKRDSGASHVPAKATKPRPTPLA
jgi:hypothetical protein